MSHDEIIDVDVLSESHLPADLFTETDGLNGMLDTFPDIARGLGVLDHDVLQAPKQPPTLPDGVAMGGDPGIDENQILFGNDADVDAFLKEGALTDLSWLEFSEQDPERLPDNPVDNAIPELEDAWGIDRRTNGISLHSNIDRDVAAYRASLHTTKTSGISETEVQDVVRQASRRIAAGVSFQDAAREAARKLGSDAPLAFAGMTAVKEDVGLIGRVFVRASDYPGCANGMWTETVRKQSATAAYVVKKQACGECVHAQDGSCSLFKKKLVASVPWAQALRRYTPVIEATGRKIASNLAPREALRQAFAQAPSGMSALGGDRPHHVVPADQVGATEARKAFSNVPTPAVVVADVSTTTALKVIARWQRAGLLSSEDLAKITKGHTGSDILRAGASRILVARQAQYSGGLNAGKMGYLASSEVAESAMAEATDTARLATEFLVEEQARRERVASREGRRIAAIERKVEAVKKQIDLGLRGRRLVAHIFRSFEASERGLAATILDPHIAKKNALEEPNFQAKAFSGLTNDARVTMVSAKDAWARLQAAHVPAPLDLVERDRARDHRRVLSSLGRWVRDGLLAKEDASRLARSTASSHDVLRVAAALIGRSKIATYSGVANDTRVAEMSRAEAFDVLARAENEVECRTQDLIAEAARRDHDASRAGKRDATIRAKVAKVEEAIERGLSGASLVGFIRKLVAKDEVAEVSALLDPVLQRTGALEAKASTPRVYEGPRLERAPTKTAHSGPAYGEADRLARWARRQMTEGFAGIDLDQLIAGRFAHSVRTAASAMLGELRSKHEGLSGHAYVDAEAYVSQVGTSGCERGALRHRANQIPAVLEMPRCASCVLRVARADGTPACSMYNKILAHSVEDIVDNPKAYQAEMIRLSGATDAERTASLFAKSYDHKEFRLGEESELDHIVLADVPQSQDIGQILFGGMEFE